MVENQFYMEAPNYKAVAMYFDRETQHPPSSLNEDPNECWWQVEADTQETANSSVLEACGKSLVDRGKVEDWQCLLVVEGDQITQLESERLSGKIGFEHGPYRKDTGSVVKRDPAWVPRAVEAVKRND
jgi:hypothetical protein